MATPTSSQKSPTAGTASSGPSTSRWARSGEPSAAFSGLGRGRGRGTGRARGGKSGRGSANPREGISTGKSDSGSVQATPAKPAALSLPTSPTTEKSPAPSPTTSSRTKTSSRRTSRAVPPVVVTVSNPAEDQSTSTSSRPQNRRKRSQSSKPATSAAPKPNVPVINDSLLRPQKARNAPITHSVTVKDTPPHLSTSLDMRTNIDALVERVRAVAMADNRPSTPGSHIDWAGDDDDSLPDLDDWGVTTGTTASNQDEMISPIMVDGLKPLPDLFVPPLTPSLSDQAGSMLSSPAFNVTADLPDSDPSELSGDNISWSEKDEPLQDVHSSDTTNDVSGASPGTTQQINSSSARQGLSSHIKPVSSGNPPLHPSLPRKPAGAPATYVKSRHGAMPMRSPSPLKMTYPTLNPVSPTNKNFEEPTHAGSTMENPSADEGISQSIHAPQSHVDDKPTQDDVDLKSHEGLYASIHAPQNIADSVSAPSNLLPHSSAPSEPRQFKQTHTRSHTVGRPPSFPRSDLNPRTSRSGYSTPRGGSPQGGSHARTHSTPPTGTNHQPRHAARPVITGDAISRLARTIGNTNATPARAAAIAATD